MTRPGEYIGQYRVVAELGRDALATVLHAIDEQLDRPVVLRVVQLAPIFLPEHAQASRQEFRRLARIAARISHPNLVTVYAFEPVGAQDLVVTEFVEGETWQSLVDDGERLSVVEAVRMGILLADALATAHDAGLAHGRVSLSNIVRRADGRPKILDLGMPKLVLGLDSVRVGDPSEDVAALAGALVGMITGVDPLASESEADVPAEPTAADALRDEFAAKAEFGVFAPVLRRAMRFDGGPGYSDGAAFRNALRAALSRDQRWAETKAGSARDDDPPEHGQAENVGTPDGSTRLILPPGLDPAEDEDPSSMRRVGLIAFLLLVVWLGFEGVRWLIAPSAGDTPAPIAGPATDIPVASRPSGSAADTVIGPGGAPSSGGAALADPATNVGSRAQNPTGASTLPRSDLGVRSATVSVRPAGTAFSVSGRAATETFADSARLTVASGDSLVVRVSRNGYIAQTRIFRGDPLRIALVPDSVSVDLRSNVPADVFMADDGAEVFLGASGARVRLPTGTHTLIFRAEGFADAPSTFVMNAPGRTYTASNMDFPAVGSIVVTVPGGWGNVTIDGGEARQTPAVFDNVTAGRHIVRVQRPGYITVVDTVEVVDGAQLRRQYELRRGGDLDN